MYKNNITYFSTHAIVRSQQRGIRRWVISFIHENADKWKYCRNDCVLLFVSEKKLKKLTEQCVITPSEASLVKGIIVIARNQLIVTVYHQKGKRIHC